jgi:D-lactate dehydrogenase (cytochrome)
MRDNVVTLSAVMANGEVIRTASRAKKSSSGYDLTRLLVGSEGTLGIITEITVRLQGIPEAISAGTVDFPTVADACNAVILTIQSGIPVARIELLDELQIRACNKHSSLGLPERPTLFLEFHGSLAGVEEQAARFGEIAQEFGAGTYSSATRPEDRSKLWQARHDVYWATIGLRPGSKVFATDVCVPISRLADCVEATQADIAESGLVCPIVGHVGDGNFHTQPCVMMDDRAEVKAAKDFAERLVERAIAMGGTCTGEHGVGQGKMHYLEVEHGLPALEVMRAIKRALDPKNIMNPGKMFAL